jgi:hypothetical protein
MLRLFDAHSGRSADGLARRVVAVSVLLAVVATGIQTVCHLVNALAFDNRYDALNAGTAGEGNAFTWASTVAAFATAYAAFVLALGGFGRTRRLFALSAVVAFFSLDDLVMIHERLADRVDTALGVSSAYVTLTWPMLYFPLLVGVSYVLWQLRLEAADYARRAVTVGLALLVLAVGLEAAVTAIRVDEADYAGNPIFESEVAVEEGAELAAWIVLAGGVTSIAVARIAALRSERSAEPSRERAHAA